MNSQLCEHVRHKIVLGVSVFQELSSQGVFVAFLGNFKDGPYWVAAS